MIKRFSLPVVSLVVGILSFVHLFGLEKAVLAIILGGFALRSVSAGEEKDKKFAYAGIALGSLYVIVLIAIAIVKGPALMGVLK